MYKSAIRRIAWCLALIPLTVSGTQGQPARVDRTRWSAVVVDADALAPQPRTYRLYQSTEQVVIALTVFNDSASTLVLNVADFLRAARIRLHAPDEVAIAVQWDSSIQRSGERFALGLSSQGDLRIDPNTGFEWRVAIRQASGSPFAPTALGDKTREPATSARTKPGPSAMAVNNKRRRRVLPRRPSLFAEPALTADADQARLRPTAVRSG